MISSSSLFLNIFKWSLISFKFSHFRDRLAKYFKIRSKCSSNFWHPNNIFRRNCLLLRQDNFYLINGYLIIRLIFQTSSQHLPSRSQSVIFQNKESLPKLAAAFTVFLLFLTASSPTAFFRSSKCKKSRQFETKRDSIKRRKKRQFTLTFV